MALYRINPEEKRLFDMAVAGEVNYFTDYYFRGPSSGTWWLPGSTSEQWSRGYDRILAEWRRQGQLETFLFKEHVYHVIYSHERSKDFPSLPAFHHSHGFLFLPWQLELHNNRTPIRTIIGGFGSGKTLSQVVSLLVHAATLPGFRAFALAPLALQAMEVYKLAMDIMDGTLFKKRFLINAPKRPNPIIVIGNDYVGETTIECYPIQDNSDKLRTLTGDMAMVDQAEKLEDLDEVIRSVGTRFRGRVPSTGRERIGTLTLVANSGDNQKLWDVYDEREHDPENYYGISPSSYDNPFLTDRDLKRFELQVGGDDESKRVYLLGGRPMGNGKEFSRDVLSRVQDRDLDLRMEEGLNRMDTQYIRLEAKGAGYYEWLLPYQPDRTYLVISDPGTDNPPNRNSPPIMVWDITEFPKNPAFLIGFVWVFGSGDIRNWATRYAEVVSRYHAIGRNGFDATGFQSGYDQWMQILESLMVEKINLSGNNKPLCLNAAKIVASKGLVKVPASLTHIFSQLARYDIMEDRTSSKLRQDLVMCFIMSCWWMQRLWYYDDSPFVPRPGYDPEDRTFRYTEDRYGYHTR